MSRRSGESAARLESAAANVEEMRCLSQENRRNDLAGCLSAGFFGLLRKRPQAGRRYSRFFENLMRHTHCPVCKLGPGPDSFLKQPGGNEDGSDYAID